MFQAIDAFDVNPVTVYFFLNLAQSAVFDRET